MDLKTPLATVLANKGKANVAHAVAPTMTVAAAVDLLNQNKIGCVLVMDQGRLVGIFTERDVLRRVVGERRNPEKCLVADVMTRELVVMRPSSTVGDAMQVISERRIRHVPLVDGSKVLGVISQGDINHWLVRDREVELQTLVEYVTGKYPG